MENGNMSFLLIYYNLSEISIRCRFASGSNLNAKVGCVFVTLIHNIFLYFYKNEGISVKKDIKCVVPQG